MLFLISLGVSFNLFFFSCNVFVTCLNEVDRAIFSFCNSDICCFIKQILLSYSSFRFSTYVSCCNDEVSMILLHAESCCFNSSFSSRNRLYSSEIAVVARRSRLAVVCEFKYCCLHISDDRVLGYSEAWPTSTLVVLVNFVGIVCTNSRARLLFRQDRGVTDGQ